MMVAAVPASAALMLYTYTGSKFATGSGTFPATPAIGDHLIVSFVADDSIPLPWASVEVTITCGSLTLTGASGPLHAMAGGLPFTWDFGLQSSQTLPYYQLIAQGTSGSVYDEIQYNTGSSATSASLVSNAAGVWTESPVPCPPAVLLLGSGLIPLAWARRRKLWRK
jgi:hypothetical protein